MRIVVTGSSGLIGSRLVAALTGEGHDVLRLVRRTPRTTDEHRWAPEHRQIDPALLDDVDAIVNLAGAGIGSRRWTDRYKEKILTSRVDATATISEALARAVAAAPGRPRVLLSASAVGFYGDTGDRPVDESAPPGTDFLALVCADWEAATAPAASAGVRVVTLRSGLVLGPGGLLGRMAPLFRLGLGGRLGSGRQFWPWIALDDEVAAIRFLLTSEISGPVNLTGPAPATNGEFTQALARLVHRPAVFAVPKVALRLALGEFATVGVLAGQRAVPARLQAAGFGFGHPDLESALRTALDH